MKVTRLGIQIALLISSTAALAGWAGGGDAVALEAERVR